MPTVNMPMPPTAFKVSAPPRGHCSVVKPRMVGQKNVMPTPKRVAAAKMVSAPAWAVWDKAKIPKAAKVEQPKRSPGGENLWMMGPAQNRKTSIMAEVYTSTQAEL